MSSAWSADLCRLQVRNRISREDERQTPPLAQGVERAYHVDMNAYTNISEGLREARLDRGWGLREAARELEIAPTSIWRIEQGHVEPSLEMIERLTALYQVKIAVSKAGVLVTWRSTKNRPRTPEPVAA